MTETHNHPAGECATETLCLSEVKPVCDQKAVNAIIKNKVRWSLGLGLLPVFVPIPFVDMAAITAVQLKMIDELSQHYGVKFSENRVKNVIGALLGSFGTGMLLTNGVSSLIRYVPVVGALSTALAAPTVAAASTYALGKVFAMHFEMGGTLLDFNPEKTRQYYEEKVKEGMKVAADLKHHATPA